MSSGGFDREMIRAASPLDQVIAELTQQSIGATAAVEVRLQCPFHDDKTPSLRVNREKQTYYCDPCKAGGDVFTFVERQCACDFSAALAFLAERAGLNDNGGKLEPEAVYPYHEERGTLLSEVVRFPGKKFRQRKPDGSGGRTWKLGNVRRVLFGLPELQNQKVAYIVEGEKDALALRGIGLVATTNAGGAGKWRNDYAQQLKAAGVESVAIVPDNDQPGREHAETVARSCYEAGLKIKIVELPDLPDKGDVSDWLAAGHTKAELIALAKAASVYTPGANDVHPSAAHPAPCTLATVDDTFRRWLGNEYDLDALHAVLATGAAERLAGDPLWLLVISGAGNAKTETVQALAGAGALVTSTISSEGALLSGSARRERAKDATGGLLRRIGERGLLVVKDVTSILAMNRDTRASLLAAFREIHDGKWERNVGTDGGRTLLWTGRVVVVGAVTTAWDRAHDVISSMGDRFVVVRMDSTTGRLLAGRTACRNTGDEGRMRHELAAVVGGVLATVNSAAPCVLTDDETERLLAAANVVTLARTGVDYDYRGDVIDAHAPEMPTRFAKQLTQLVRGAVAIGVGRDTALRLALRCARDSMPPLRLAILDDVAAHPGSQTRDVRRRLGKPRSTVDRQLQSLHMLGVLTCDEAEEATRQGEPVTRWHYYLAQGIDPDVLDPEAQTLPEMSPHTGTGKKEGSQKERVCIPTDISGQVETARASREGLKL